MRPARALTVLALVALVALPAIAWATPFIWDQDGDGLDDRVESVHLLGYSYAFQSGDTLQPQRIQVVRAGGGLVFGVYVEYDHPVTATDIAALTALGMPALHVYQALPAVRTLATFAQAQAAVALAGVTRVEAVPMIYPMVRAGAADLGVRDPSGQVFPTWSLVGGSDGAGQVIAFLDTGINDAPDGTWPGHESLLGRFVGGASFVNGDSISDTPIDGSENPEDRGGAATHAHGTHVAGIALGSGGSTGYCMGVAPGARFVDVKVLNDAGVGAYVADGLDWCIHNRSRSWGITGATGISVVNMSLSSTDPSDGNDFVSELAERAVQLGIVVVASMGNAGQHPFVPSPAAGRGVIAVGAMDDQRTGLPEDDVWSADGDYGPRADDGDGDASDEQKPDLLAPGIAVLSANGDMTTDGAQYQRLSGTSMSAAFVSGIAAALRGDDAALTPGQVAALLRATARRDLAGTPPGATGIDPRWSAPLGFGVPDLYAARLELLQPDHSQVVALEFAGDSSRITATLRTQRERNTAQFVFERAPDQGGTPGAFAPYDSVAAAGDSSLTGVVDRTTYTRVWNVTAPERGVTFWYRVAWWEGATRFASPARTFTSPVGPSPATIQLTVVHNAWDHDVSGQVSVGTAPTGLASATPSGASSSSASFPLPGTAAAVSSDWVDGVSETGNIEWTFDIPVPAGVADAWLPPTPSYPWTLTLHEGGYLDRSGRLTGFRIIWHAPGGDQVFEGGPVPQQTLEGQSITATVPQSAAGVGPAARPLAFACAPNPVRAGASVTFTFASPLAASAVLIADAGGRIVARVPVHAGAARWNGRDGAGRPVAPGMYFARAGTRASARFAVLGR
ncbi:MAG TPA: S8 family serine peptidase [Candidatus Eisenbacteria bacterium]|nr:S8 family serine peptidase [Candidatus Eisenbacteria bacterium]